jgi:hypothetical protein
MLSLLRVQHFHRQMVRATDAWRRKADFSRIGFCRIQQ